MQPLHSRSPIARRAASLLEVLAVVIIMGILAVTAVPSISVAREATQAAATYELRRQLELARAYATASGQPAGLLVDWTQSTAQIVRLGNAQIVAAQDALAQAHASVDYPGLYQGTRLMSLSGGLQHTTGESLWFAFDGTPHRRNLSGQGVATLQQPAVYQLSNGAVVRVEPVGGLIE